MFKFKRSKKSKKQKGYIDFYLSDFKVLSIFSCYSYKESGLFWTFTVFRSVPCIYHHLFDLFYKLSD